MVLDGPHQVREALARPGVTLRGWTWATASGRTPRDEADRSYLRIRVNVDRGIRTYFVDVEDVPSLQDVLDTVAEP